MMYDMIKVLTILVLLLSYLIDCNCRGWLVHDGVCCSDYNTSRRRLSSCMLQWHTIVFIPVLYVYCMLHLINTIIFVPLIN